MNTAFAVTAMTIPQAKQLRYITGGIRLEGEVPFYSVVVNVHCVFHKA